MWENHEAQIPKQVFTGATTQKSHQQSNHVIAATRANSQSAVEKTKKKICINNKIQKIIKYKFISINLTLKTQE